MTGVLDPNDLARRWNRDRSSTSARGPRPNLGSFGRSIAYWEELLNGRSAAVSSFFAGLSRDTGLVQSLAKRPSAARLAGRSIALPASRSLPPAAASHGSHRASLSDGRTFGTTT